MATYYSEITPEQADLIERSPVFFVGSADPTLGTGPHGIGPSESIPQGGQWASCTWDRIGLPISIFMAVATKPPATQKRAGR